MSMSHRFPVEQAFDQNGDPLSGAKLYVYNTGTLVFRTVYSNDALSTALTNPVIADSAGRFPNIYVQPGQYRAVLKTSADVVVFDNDPVDPGLSGSSGPLSLALGGSGASTAAGARANFGVPSLSVTTGIDARLTTAEQTLAAPILETENVTTYAATIALNFTVKKTQTVTLTGNVTFLAPTVTTNETIRVITIQDATGGRVVVWNSAFKFEGGTPPAASRTGNAVDVWEGFVRSSSEIQMVRVKVQDVRPSSMPDIILEDSNPSGTNGGTATSGVDETRRLNLEVFDRLNICGLASNQFTISGAGTYYFEWDAPAFDIGGGHQSILRDVTGTADLKRGKTAYCTGQMSSSDGAFVHTFSGATNTYEIRHRVTATKNLQGYGIPSSLGTEVYTRVKIWKVA